MWRLSRTTQGQAGSGSFRLLAEMELANQMAGLHLSGAPVPLPLMAGPALETAAAATAPTSTPPVPPTAPPAAKPRHRGCRGGQGGRGQGGGKGYVDQGFGKGNVKGFDDRGYGGQKGKGGKAYGDWGWSGAKVDWGRDSYGDWGKGGKGAKGWRVSDIDAGKGWNFSRDAYGSSAGGRIDRTGGDGGWGSSAPIRKQTPVRYHPYGPPPSRQIIFNIAYTGARGKKEGVSQIWVPDGTNEVLGPPESFVLTSLG